MALGLKKRLANQTGEGKGETVFQRQVQAGTPANSGAPKRSELTKEEERELAEKHMDEYINKMGQKG